MAQKRAHGAGGLAFRLQREQGVKRAGSQILLGLGKLLVVVSDPQLLQVVAAVGGGEQVGGQFGVKPDALGLNSLVHQFLLQLLGPVDHLLDVGGEEGLEHLVVILQPVGKEQSSVALRGAGVEADANSIQAGQS